MKDKNMEIVACSNDVRNGANRSSLGAFTRMRRCLPFAMVVAAATTFACDKSGAKDGGAAEPPKTEAEPPKPKTVPVVDAGTPKPTTAPPKTLPPPEVGTVANPVEKPHYKGPCSGRIIEHLPAAKPYHTATALWSPNDCWTAIAPELTTLCRNDTEPTICKGKCAGATPGKCERWGYPTSTVYTAPAPAHTKTASCVVNSYSCICRCEEPLRPHPSTNWSTGAVVDVPRAQP